jgi:hypothetical protein
MIMSGVLPRDGCVPGNTRVIPTLVLVFVRKPQLLLPRSTASTASTATLAATGQLCSDYAETGGQVCVLTCALMRRRTHKEDELSQDRETKVTISCMPQVPFTKVVGTRD